MIIIALSLAMVIYSSNELFSRSNKTIIINKIFDENPERLDLTTDNFYMAFSLEFPTNDSVYRDDSIYVVEAVQFVKEVKYDPTKKNNVENFKLTPIELAPCSMEELTKNFDTTNVPKAGLWCPKNISTLFFQGTWAS